MPAVQKPHCRAWFSWNAGCTGCSSSSDGASPSIVVTRCAVGLGGEHRAGLHRLTVEQDGARPARRRVAADLGAGQAAVLPEVLDQQRARLDVVDLLDAVHRHGYLHAASPQHSGLHRWPSGQVDRGGMLSGGGQEVLVAGVLLHELGHVPAGGHDPPTARERRRGHRARARRRGRRRGCDDVISVWWNTSTSPRSAYSAMPTNSPSRRISYRDWSAACGPRCPRARFYPLLCQSMGRETTHVVVTCHMLMV